MFRMQQDWSPASSDDSSDSDSGPVNRLERTWGWMRIEDVVQPQFVGPIPFDQQFGLDVDPRAVLIQMDQAVPAPRVILVHRVVIPAACGWCNMMAYGLLFPIAYPHMGALCATCLLNLACHFPPPIRPNNLDRCLQYFLCIFRRSQPLTLTATHLVHYLAVWFLP